MKSYFRTIFRYLAIISISLNFNFSYANNNAFFNKLNLSETVSQFNSSHSIEDLINNDLAIDLNFNTKLYIDFFKENNINLKTPLPKCTSKDKKIFCGYSSIEIISNYELKINGVKIYKFDTNLTQLENLRSIIKLLESKNTSFMFSFFLGKRAEAWVHFLPLILVILYMTQNSDSLESEHKLACEGPNFKFCTRNSPRVSGTCNTINSSVLSNAVRSRIETLKTDIPNKEKFVTHLTSLGFSISSIEGGNTKVDYTCNSETARLWLESHSKKNNRQLTDGEKDFIQLAKAAISPKFPDTEKEGYVKPSITR